MNERPMMYLVAIETSSARGSLALFGGGSLVEESRFPKGLVHGREISVHLDGLMDRHRLKPEDLGALAVSAGPGSYTGIRVGVTAAKTLGFALGIPVLAVSSLEVLAQNGIPDFPRSGPPPISPIASGESGPALLVAVDGKQGSLYWAAFRPVKSGLERASGDELLQLHSIENSSFSAFGSQLQGDALVFGDGADLLLASWPSAEVSGHPFRDRGRRAPAAWDWPRAAALGRCALQNWPRDPADPLFSDPQAIHRLLPVYLRPSEAELKLGARSTG